VAKTTGIAYCDSTLNVEMGCTGCELYPAMCYAKRLCDRFAGRKGWPEAFTAPELFTYRWALAWRWEDMAGTGRPEKPWLDGAPRIVFVNDLGDGFCPDVDADRWLTPWLEQVAHSPHIYLLLTKWPQRMAAFFQQHTCPSNVWPGTTVTTQRTIDRVAALASIDANVRWLSVEPMLASLDLGRRPSASVDWVVCGGGSGAKAPPLHPDAVRRLRDQCLADDVAFFFKQWGEWLPNDQFDGMDWQGQTAPMHRWNRAHTAFRVGRQGAGRLLDGEPWTQMPPALATIDRHAPTDAVDDRDAYPRFAS
jgi:protein gp37